MNSVALRVPQASGMYLEVQDGFVRQSHLAPPVVAPDSPRPQKAATATESLAATTLTVPTEKAPSTKSGPTTRAASKSPNRASKKK